jgi:hypothetical protein
MRTAAADPARSLFWSSRWFLLPEPDPRDAQLCWLLPPPALPVMAVSSTPPRLSTSAPPSKLSCFPKLHQQPHQQTQIGKGLRIEGVQDKTLIGILPFGRSLSLCPHRWAAGRVIMSTRTSSPCSATASIDDNVRLPQSVSRAPFSSS